MTTIINQNKSKFYNKRKLALAMFVISLIVLCVLGLSMLPNNGVKSSVTMKDVTLNFNGNAVNTITDVFVNGVSVNPIDSLVTVAVPMGQIGNQVQYTYSADVEQLVSVVDYSYFDTTSIDSY